MKELCQILTSINEKFSLSLDILGLNDYGIGKEEYLRNFQELEFKNNQNYYYPIFKNLPVENPLASFISKQEKTQLHIAETEKYNHVTYFFNGGQNKKWNGETWHVIDSNKVQSHAEKPQMKAKEITDYILENGLGKYDYIIVNYANPDMLGHTGNIPASIESMEALDTQMGRLIKAVEEGNHKMLITADHGNIEMVGKYTYKKHILTDTEHNPNPVPCILVDPEFNTENLQISIKNIVEEYSLEANIQSILQVLSNENNRINLDNPETWLEKSNIPKAQWPLWYAGLILLGM